MAAREKASDEMQDPNSVPGSSREAIVNARSLQRLQLTEHGRDQF